MPPEIIALIDKPLLLIAVLFVGALFGMTVEQVVSKQRREAWKRKRAARGERPPRYGRVYSAKFTKGVLAKYAKLVHSASTGAYCG